MTRRKKKNRARRLADSQTRIVEPGDDCVQKENPSSRPPNTKTWNCSDKMNLLMLNYEFPPIGGGAGKANQCLLQQYAGIGGLKVDVLTSSTKPGFVREDFAENIAIYKVGLHKKHLHYWRRTEVIEWLFKARSHHRRLLRENDYDLAHAFFGFPTGYLPYRTASRLPYIISLRGSDVPGYNTRLGLDYKLTSGLFRRIWSRASAVVANSKGLKQLALEFMPGLEIGIIPNGIDTQRFHPPQEQVLGEPIKLLTVGRLITRKRIDLLIKAVDCARKLGLNVRLDIAGHGNILPELRSLADRLGVAENVTFLERVPAEQMPQLYRDADIFVMSSAHEGMSNAMLEAMASGLPIVTTRCEGVEELIWGNGFVVERAESEEIAAAIKKLSEEQILYRQMSATARKQAEKFSWNNVALSYIEQYGRVRR